MLPGMGRTIRMRKLLAFGLSLPLVFFFSTMAVADDDDEPIDFDTTPEEYTATDVEDLISIREPQDVDKLRSELISILWGKPGLPATLPSSVEKQFADGRYEDITSLNRIEKLEISMDFGLESIAYHFIPTNSNNRAVLYHQGHKGDFYNSKVQISQFLDNGYSVIAFSMPLYGLNNRPTIQLPRIGDLKLLKHEQMKFLTPEHGHPIKYFVEPVVTALNYLEGEFYYSSVAMVGISGGGWTTTLAAALDTRIGMSFPVAGSYPIYLRSNAERDWGDYEQSAPELYTVVNYLELYILGAYGTDRKQLQIINKYDSCCFAGIKWETYIDVVKTHIRQLGSGEYDLFLDDSHEDHLVSPLAMTQILNALASRGAHAGK